jgi:quinolinate synthase
MTRLVKKIQELKMKKDAVILAHNYQLPEVQDIADQVGDSLELARASRAVDAGTIVFCGVHFMAETAKIFNPEKLVLMPDIHAGCPMANMITPERLQREKDAHPRAAVITYINSTAEIKAMADICCTSANGVKVARSLKESEILFVPDKYLGSFVARQVPDKTFHLYNGYCPTHMLFSRDGITKLKAKNPGAKVVVHPECRTDVQEMADAVCSTSQMISYTRENEADTFIIGTEIGMLHRLRKDVPGKKFIPGNPYALCPNMKLTTLEKILWSLEDSSTEILVDETVMKAAYKVIERMVAL